jgi:hypothetical protein
VTGGIGNAGDGTVRTALHEAADVMPTRTGRVLALRRWAVGVAGRRGMERGGGAGGRAATGCPHLGASTPRRWRGTGRARA